MALPLPASTPLTYQDLERLPDDGRRYELIDGSLVVTPVPAPVHQLVVGALSRLLWPARRAGTAVLAGPVEFVSQLTTSLQPDVVVIEEGEIGEARLTRPPLLVGEVLSPSSRRHDLGSKRLAYAAAGVPFYWLLDPEPPVMLTVLRLAGEDYESVAEVRGEEEFVADEPFPVSLVPARLLDV
ncbi:MAG: Uma2 family endonuclease [Actinomycetota bacterium]|nr:Uma2 family endonuclease [Actinomycetota bacterium]